MINTFKNANLKEIDKLSLIREPRIWISKSTRLRKNNNFKNNSSLDVRQLKIYIDDNSKTQGSHLLKKYLINNILQQKARNIIGFDMFDVSSLKEMLLC